MKGRKLTEEHKRKIGLRRKGKNHSQKTKKLIALSKKGKKRPMEVIEKIRKTLTGRKISLTHKMNIAKGCINIGKKRFPYKKKRYRSRWEVAMVKRFDELNFKFRYEPKIFKLKSGPYIPDFQLTDYQDTWIEVKGFYRKECKQKHKEFSEGHFLIVLDTLKQIRSFSLN